MKGLCEIGFNLDHCWLEFQLSREAALAFGWEQLPEDAEVYGAEQYLMDFYTALSFPPDVEEAALLAAAENCRRWKTETNRSGKQVVSLERCEAHDI